MSKCPSCGKFYFLQTFSPSDKCSKCKAKIKEQEELERQEKEKGIKEELDQTDKLLKEVYQILSESKPSSFKEKKLPDEYMGSFLSYHYQDVDLFVPDTLTFDLLSTDTFLTARREPDNKYDPNAVCFLHNDTVVAYFYKGRLQKMANEYLDRHDEVCAIVTDKFIDKNRIKVKLGFYEQKEKAISIRARRSNAKEYRLIGNQNREMQSNIPCLEIGDECCLFYDIEKEKYLVFSGGDIGYLPKDAEEVVNMYDDDECFICVSDFYQNSSDKYVVSVYIFTDK